MYNKVQQIKNLQANDVVNDIFVVKAKRGIQPYANDSKYRFELRLGDSSSEIDLKFWGGEDLAIVQELYDIIKVDEVIFLQGKVNEFNNNLEISSNQGVHELRPLQAGEYNATAFLKKTDKDIELMFSELVTILNNVQNPELKNLVQAFLNDQSFVQKFKTTPASHYRYHAYIGGLLQHSLAVTKICLKVAEINNSISANSVNPKHGKGLDKDLLIVGAAFHAIGKIEYHQLSTSIKVSKSGIMQGSVVAGWKMMQDKMKAQLVSEELKLKLENIMLSHLGKKEYGATTLPKTPEALVISIAKELDSKVNGMLNVKTEADQNEDFAYSKDFGAVFLK
ncbi:MAG: HD domain-containing protein [archaeon]|nr:HD domain-containing protein [Nanoarchaeota archaeon]